jgi:hypothetical protein
VLPEAKLLRALRRLRAASSHGPWVRCVRFDLLLAPPPGAPDGSPPQPLWPNGAAQVGARFTPIGSFGTIYLASDPMTALLEVDAIFKGAKSLNTSPLVLFAVQGALDRVLDLTHPQAEEMLGTSLSELTGDWRVSESRFLKGHGPLPPCQLLGKVAYESQLFDSIKYPTSKDVLEGTGWAVFADRLTHQGRSYLKVKDDHGVIDKEIP